MLSRFSHIWLSAIPVALQAPLSMGFSQQEHTRSELPFPSPGDLPDPGMEPKSLVFPAYAGSSLYHWATGEAYTHLLSLRLRIIFIFLVNNPKKYVCFYIKVWKHFESGNHFFLKKKSWWQSFNVSNTHWGTLLEKSFKVSYALVAEALTKWWLRRPGSRMAANTRRRKADGEF